MFDTIDQLAVNTIRTLSVDAVEAANSGHPGLPMGAAPMAYALWAKHYNTNPKNSQWFNRDRFILSAGHGSAMLYSLLHLSGFDVSIEDLKKFRQLGSKLPGHPEVHLTDGVEATTGPLGQGIANGVGMAMAEAHLADTYNKEDYPIVDHHTYVLCSDGDLQEGISHEAASLAGHLKLGKLIMLYDSNDVQLDGPTDKAFSEDIHKRFEAYGWDYGYVEDGNNIADIDEAIEKAKTVTDKPTIIEIRTEIGFGAENAGTSAVHGAPLGPDGTAFAKKSYKWEEEDFFVPEEVYDRFNKNIAENGQKLEADWNQLLEDYKKDYPELAERFEQAMKDELPKDWQENLPVYEEGTDAIATRSVSGEVINAIAEVVPNFWGGSADLSGSNKTMIDSAEDFSSENYAGRNIWYGVREHAMASALNGILLHGGTKSFVSTFFVFSDYLRPAVRLAALSEIPAIYVLTHDSVAVGEDGPTHEPIEQLSSYRGMPNVAMLRPADANEVVAAWKVALESKTRPTLLALTRQDLPILPNTEKLAMENVEKGAYVLSPAEGEAEGLLLATGSEVQLAMEAQKELREKGHDVAVVSMPSFELFELQSEEYKESVLPKHLTKRVAIEMGTPFGWDRYAGTEGKIMAIDRFGASGKGEEVIESLGFTVEKVVKEYLSMN
ncbi:transketolase [Atopostipes suicloacalis DSM 15692]|uniref:Transketolase n=1 Tax=Atopostipes suicloacalis DSM 15692 TaxID=1121025 RepID=A0A1M4VK98_9LACT|nr:transketolase [Atopostipes suicloacalis]SHE69429.1 transketolase [Atopostipes suicloacalis DSM 15692]